jgi:aerobic carbon-monoxide dehydrogenase large subunit
LASSPWVGRSIAGRSDINLIKGEGTYVDDVRLPGMVYAGFIRSPYAHARLIGLAKGKDLPPGVLDVVTGEEVHALCKPVDSVESIYHPNLKTQGAPWYALPSDKARYVGEPVAAFVVEEKDQLEDAMDSIEFEYEPLDAVTTVEQGMSKDSPKLYDGWKDNTLLRFDFSGGDVDGALAKADCVIETKLKMHRHTASPIENRAYVADYDKKASFLTMWSTTQAPHVARTYLSGILNLPENSIRVIQPDVGGAFGRGHPVYPEEILVCLLSMRLGRPVKWLGSRRDCLMTDVHAREQTHELKAGFRKDGTLLAVDDKIVVDMGVFQPTGGVPSNIVTAKLIPGPYRLQNYRVKQIGVCTNKSAFGAYRGFGKESAALAYERLMDMAAERLGIDPAAIRLKNFIRKDEFPYTSVIGETYDSGDYTGCFQKALRLADYEGLRRQQAEFRKQGRHIGIGLAYSICPCSMSNPDNLYTSWDSATVTMDPSGNITVLAGVTSPGTQHSTTFSQIAADEFGVNPDQVRVVEGDTLACPYGSGNWSDRGATIGGSAVLAASRKLKEKIATIAAYKLGVEPGRMVLKNGRVQDSKSGGSASLGEIGWMAHTAPSRLPPGVEPGLTATATFSLEASHTIGKTGRWGMYPIYSNNATIIVVEVDTETLQTKILRYLIVDDSGRMINPAVVNDQLVGAAAQGVSGAFLEELFYDENGQLLSSTFMDYLIASSVESSIIEVDHFEVPSPLTPMGTKGAGESGIVGTYAALCAAVEDALRPFGVKITGLPLSPEKLWNLVKTARAPS